MNGIPSPHDSNVTIIPADPKMVLEEFERESRRTALNSELSGLYQDICSFRTQLEEDDSIIDLILQKRNQLAEKINSMEQRIQELETELKNL